MKESDFGDVVKSQSYALDHGRRRFDCARLKMLFIYEVSFYRKHVLRMMIVDHQDISNGEILLNRILKSICTLYKYILIVCKIFN